MSRLTGRLEKLEAAREAYWASLSDEQIEAMIGPRFMESLDRQPLEDLQRLANKDPGMDAQIWRGYLAWLEAQE